MPNFIFSGIAGNGLGKKRTSWGVHHGGHHDRLLTRVSKEKISHPVLHHDLSHELEHFLKRETTEDVGVRSTHLLRKDDSFKQHWHEMQTLHSALDMDEIHRPIGQARQKVYVNTATGNVYLEDHSVILEDCGFNVRVGVVYNSQATATASAWRFTLAKQIAPPQNMNQTGSQITLTEEDGSSTVFNYDAAQECYVATGLVDGNETLTWESDKGSWQWYQAGTGLVANFSSAGYQQNLVDPVSLELKYSYDSQNRLMQISLPSGRKLKIQYDTGSFSVAYTGKNNHDELLSSHTQDSQGRILASIYYVSADANLASPTTRGIYRVDYQYDSNSARLIGATQTDGSSLHFAYDGNHRVVSVTDGEGRSQTLTYYNNQTNIFVTMTDTVSYATYDIFDSQQRLIERIESIDDTTRETTFYTYAAGQQLVSVRYDDGGTEAFSYDDNGLLNTFMDGVGNIQTTQHNDDGVLESHAINGEFTTNFSHDDKRQLCYVVTPEGYVRQFNYDASGNRESERGFLKESFSINQDAGNLKDVLDAWTAQQDLQQTTLSEFDHNKYGQVTAVRRYSDLNADGSGIENAAMSLDSFTWNPNGKLKKHTQRQSYENGVSNDSTTLWSYDGLLRLTQHTDAAGNITQYIYQDAQSQCRITLPNGLQRAITWDRGFRVVQIIETDGVQTRKTEFIRNPAGNVQQVIQPDGYSYYFVHDGQHRLQYAIDPQGYVEEFTRDARHHVQDRIAYADAIAIGEIEAIGVLTSDDIDRRVVVNSSDDRRRTRLHDRGNRLRYEIDGENNVVEHRYDSANRRYKTYAYAMPLENADERDLDAEGELSAELTIDTQDDRVVTTVYNNDHQVVRTQDSEGYVTSNSLDLSGHLLQSAQYANPSELSEDAIIIIPDSSSSDVIQSYFRDGRQQVVGIVESSRATLSDPQSAQNYLTRHSRLACGLIDTTTRYAIGVNLVGINLQDLLAINQLVVVTNSEDHTTGYAYDALNREIIRAESPFGLRHETDYDCMGNVTRKAKIDANNSSEQRTFAFRYNAWNQETQALDPRAYVDIIGVTDPAQIATTWNDFSSINTYDDSGLLLSRRDPIGNMRYFYYDNKRQPVFTVNPRGALRENTYDAFDEKPVTTRHYATFLTDLGALTGGFITPELQRSWESLRVDGQDSVTLVTRDRRGLDVAILNAENYLTQIVRNAFGETIEENQQINATQSLTTQTLYDRRGLPSQVIVDPDAIFSRTVFAYNFQRQKSTVTDANGNQTAYLYDHRARQINVTDALQKTTSQTWDAFNRVVTQIDRCQQTTQHAYTTSTRTSILTTPAGRQLTTLTNVYAEVLTITDNNGNTKSYEYEPGGERIALVDELGRREEHDFNKVGWRTARREPNQIQTIFSHSTTGEVTQHVNDSEGLALSTQYDHDSQDRESHSINPLNVKRQTLRDRLGLLTSDIQDPFNESDNPSGLHITTQTAYNGLKQPERVIVGDKSAENQQEKQLIYDTAGRLHQSIVDPVTNENPNGLALKTTSTLDAVGNKLSTTNPRGNISRVVLNALNQRRFSIDPTGAVIRYDYDNEQRLLERRSYFNLLTNDQLTLLNDQTTENDLFALLVEAVDDRRVLQRFNADGDLVYEINTFGQVTQKYYDAAGRLIGQTQYSNVIDLNALIDTTIDSVAALLVSNLDKDQTTFFVLDAAAQPRYKIDSDGCVVEQIFDEVGKITKIVAYAEPLPNYPEGYFNGSVPDIPSQEGIQGLLQPNSEQDRTTYQVFDRLSRKVYGIDALGYVQESQYDNQNNVTKTIRYATPINVGLLTDINQATVADAVAQIQSETQDRITQHVYDAIDRKQKTTDGLGYFEGFTHDALGQLIQYSDKRGKIWESTFDRANRKIGKKSPPVKITTTTLTSDGSSIQYEIETAAIETRHEYDEADNGIRTIEGYGRTDARSVEFSYDACNRPQVTTQENVLVDDATQTPTSSTRPDALKILTTEIRYNAFGLPVANKNAAGYWRFTIFNAEGRVAYEIDPSNYVTYYERDTFHRPIKITRYATPLNLTLNPDTAATLTLAQINNGLVVSSQDRVIENAYDRRGNKISTTLSEVYLYTRVGEEDHLGIASPKTTWAFNAFSENTVKSQLVDPIGNISADEYYFFDQRGNQTAEISAEGYVTIYQSNLDCACVEKTEYAVPIDINNPPATFEELQAQLITSSKDRCYRAVYDQMGRKIQDIQVGVVTQKITYADDGGPHMEDAPAQDLVTATGFDEEGRKISVTLPNGGTTYQSYDDHGRLEQEINPVRETEDDDGNPISYTEVKTFGNNAYGNQVMVVRDAVTVGNQSLVMLESPSSTAQVTLRAIDPSRSVVIAEQNPKGQMNYASYTANQQIARQWQYVKLWDVNSLNIVKDENGDNASAQIDPVVCLYQKRSEYDARDQKYFIYERQETDDDLVTQIFWNAFSEDVGAGPGDGTSLLYKLYDNAGRIYLRNDDKGVPVLCFYDGLNNQTAALRSPSAVNLGNLATDPTAALTVFATSKTKKQKSPKVQKTQSQTNYRRDKKSVPLEPINNFVVKKQGFSAEEILLGKKGRKHHQRSFKLKTTPTLVAGDSNLNYASYFTDYDYTQMQKTIMMRDRNGNVVEQHQPVFTAQDPTKAEPLYTAFTIGTQYPEFGTYSISWPDSGEETLQPVMTLRVSGTDESTATAYTATLVNKRWGIDISALTTDVYQYSLFYYYKNLATGEIDYDYAAYEASGVMPITTNNNGSGQNPVISQTADATLSVSGNISNLAGIELWQDDQCIDRVALPYNSSVDLSEQISGTYTVKPIYGPLIFLDETVSIMGQTSSGTTFEICSTSIASTGTNISWQNLPKICQGKTLQGRYYATRPGVDDPVKNSATANDLWRAVENITGVASGNHEYSIQNLNTAAWSGDGSIYSVSNQLFLIDDNGSSWYLGSSANSDNYGLNTYDLHYDEHTKISHYLYVYPAEGETVDAIILITVSSRYTLQLLPWANGVYRAAIPDEIDVTDKTAFQVQLLQLPVQTDEPEEDMVDISVFTRHKSEKTMARYIPMDDFAVVEQNDRAGLYIDYILPKDLLQNLLLYAEIHGTYQWYGVPSYTQFYAGLDWNPDMTTNPGEYHNNGYHTYGSVQFPFNQVLVKIRLGNDDVGDNNYATLVNQLQPYFTHDPDDTYNCDYHFSGQLVYFSPLPGNIASAELDYQDLGSEEWAPGDIQILTNGIALTNTNLDKALYQYRLKAYDASGALIDLSAYGDIEDGYLTGTFRCANSTDIITTPDISTTYTLVQPTIEQTFDRWDNALSITDPLGHTTTAEFNAFNRKSLEQKPAVEITHENGSTETVQPTTRWGVNTMGSVVGEQDPNGNVVAHEHNLLEEVIKTTNGESVYQQFILDGLGRIRKTRDPLGNTLVRDFDACDQIVRQTDARGWTTDYEYNERQQRLSVTDGLGNVTRTNSDKRHNVIITVQPLGQYTATTFDRNAAVVDSDQRIGGCTVMHSDRDFFGNESAFTDLSGVTVDITRDNNKIMTRRKKNGSSVSHVQTYDDLLGHVPPTTTNVTVPDQDIQYTQDEAGYTRWILDYGVNCETRYIWDAKHSLVGERFQASDGRVYQSTLIRRNACDWVIQLQDVTLQAVWAYDACSNRRSTNVYYIYDGSSEVCPYVSWYTYNRANQFTTVRGVFNTDTNSIEINSTQGIFVDYDRAGRRSQEITQDTYGNTLTNDITYFPNNLVQQAWRSDGIVITYDWYPNYSRKSYSKTSDHTYVNTYNANGWMTLQDQDNGSVQTSFSQFDNVGNPCYQHIAEPSSSDAIYYDLTLRYMGFDSMKIIQNSGTLTEYRYENVATSQIQTEDDDDMVVIHTPSVLVSEPGAGTETAHSQGILTEQYDANGYTSIMTGTADDQYRDFIVNAEGRIVYVTNGLLTSFPQPVYKTERYFYIFGSPWGRYGDIPPDDASEGNVVFPSDINFDLSYHVLDEHYPTPTSTKYTVLQGDVFTLISTTEYGDDTYASKLAQANGYQETDTPPVGLTLTVPPLVGSGRNWEGVYAAYDENKIIGSDFPYIPIPTITIPQHHHFWQTLLEVFVETAILCCIPSLAGALPATLGLFGQGAFAGLMLGSAADGAEQLTRIVLKDQKGFSLTSVVESGLENGLSAGIMGANGIYGYKLSKVGQAVKYTYTASDFFAASAESIGALQIGKLATGIQHNIDWKDVMASSLISTSGFGIGKLFPTNQAGVNNHVGEMFASNFTQTVVSQVISGVVYHQHFDFETVSATTLGTFTGNLGAGLLQGGSDERQSKGKPSKTGFSVPNPSTRLKQLEEQWVESPYSMSSLIQDYAPDYASEQINELDSSLMSIFSVTSTSSTGRDSSNPISSNSNKRPSTSTSSNQSNFWKPETRSQTEKSAVHSDLQSRNQWHVQQAGSQSTEDEIAQFLFNHQGEWWDKAILAGMHGVNRMVESSAYQSLDRSVRMVADVVSAFDPFSSIVKGEYELHTGINPITGMHVSPLQAKIDIGMSFLPMGEAVAVKGFTALKELGLFSVGSKVESTLSTTTELTQHPLQGWSADQVLQHVNELGVKAPRDRYMLWSGLGRNGISESQAHARASGGVTLEMTEGGKWLNQMNLFGKDSPFSRVQAREIWFRTSMIAAKQASGQVTALIGAVSPSSIYRAEQVELLMNNKIIGIEEINLKPKYIFGK